MKCFYCSDSEQEMRPYGPNGSMVCFGCAFSTKERQEETSKNFSSQLEQAASGGDIVVIGTEAGPYPLKQRQ